MEKSKNNNRNIFNGEMNFSGTTQIAAGDIINGPSDADAPKANYTPEPIWRSPFTMAVLSWISLAMTIGGVFPLSKIVKNILDVFNRTPKILSDFEIQIYITISIILFLLSIVAFILRRITKNQTRHPLRFNFAISGYGKRLTLEKIHIDKCPQCGGKMKYYNKPVEWVDKYYSDGNSKREITKKIPVLECKRNSEHYYNVDPAEDRVN